MMNTRNHVFWEILLILGSVLVFRGLWNLLDNFPTLNSTAALSLSLIVGLLAVGAAFYALNRHY